MEERVVVDRFEIPEELAKELSDLLVKQSIQERLLESVISDRERYEEVMNRLVPVVRQIETIKAKITKDYVPKQYLSSEYIWNYDGYDIAGNIVEILH